MTKLRNKLLFTFFLCILCAGCGGGSSQDTRCTLEEVPDFSASECLNETITENCNGWVCVTEDETQSFNRRFEDCIPSDCGTLECTDPVETFTNVRAPRPSGAFFVTDESGVEYRCTTGFP